MHNHKTIPLKIFNSINDFSSNKKTILTLGTFDGVHIGHKKILEKVTQGTENSKYESVVLTFSAPTNGSSRTVRNKVAKYDSRKN